MTVTLTLVVTTLVLAYQLRIFEIVYYRSLGLIDFDDYFQAVWVIVITICTVGFGDLVPFSQIGRVIIMVTAIWGSFIISLVIVVAANLFMLSRSQKKAMHHLFLTRKAAASIIAALRYNLELKKIRAKMACASSNTDIPLQKD